MSEALDSPLGEDRTRALLAWLCRRDVLAWDIVPTDDEASVRLRMLRGFRAAFVDVPPDAQIPRSLEALLPRPHTRIFLSYFRGSGVSHAADPFRTHLEARGYAVFVDEHASAATRDWRHDLLYELRRCDVLVAVVTEEYWHSPFCQQEIGGAYALGKSVVMFSDGTAPQGFASVEQFERIPLDPWLHQDWPTIGELLAQRTAAIYEQRVRDGAQGV